MNTGNQEFQFDRLSALLERFRVRAQLFHSGALCDVTRFDAQIGRGFLHVLRRGELDLHHQPRSGLPRRLHIKEPSLIFYPQPRVHEFHNAPKEGCDFTCAVVEFEQGAQHPLVRALPALVVLPLAQVKGLEQALTLLFAEAEEARCGQRLLVDRLFEVVLIQLLRWLIQHPQESGEHTGLIKGLADPQLARALIAIHEAPGHPWTLEEMAQQAAMSRSSFAARFKQVLQETPADYLSNWRLAIAKQELQRGKPLQVIAHELAYANASALSRMFAQKMGVSPMGWLRGRTLRTSHTKFAS
ncbi:MAG: AraC family transcriptional regulator [Burkholderiales bacterium]|nr:AraC family transcriptional regulator [Burkholderiales bacterium]